MMEQKGEKENPQTAVLYFTRLESSQHDLLFYEERLIRDSPAENDRHSFWSKVKSKFDQYSYEAFASDRFIRRLRRIRNIRVMLGKPIDQNLVRTKIREMLRDRKYHHLRWLIIDAALLPLSVLLAPLPGPNLLGYYLLLRVYMHWKAFRSASGAKLENVDVQVSSQAEEMTTLLQKTNDVRTALHELRKRYGLRALQENQFVPQLESLKNTWRRINHSDARPAK